MWTYPDKGSFHLMEFITILHDKTSIAEEIKGGTFTNFLNSLMYNIDKVKNCVHIKQTLFTCE